MTIIDCLFYAFGSLSSDVLLEYIAKLVVAGLQLTAIKLKIRALTSQIVGAKETYKLNHGGQTKMHQIPKPPMNVFSNGRNMCVWPGNVINESGSTCLRSPKINLILGMGDSKTITFY